MSHIKNLGTLLVTVSICFVLAEIGLRMFDQVDENSVDIGDSFGLSDYMIHDPVLGWKLLPNAAGTLKTPEYETSIRINSNGIRDVYIPYRKTAQEQRLLILGDSFTEGYTVALEERFSNLIEMQMNAGSLSPITVVNMGVGGYSSDQQVLQFRTEGVKYDPDVVLLIFYDNDVYYNIKNKYWRGHKPVFKASDTDLVITNVPVPLPDRAEPDLANERATSSIWQSAKSWISSNLRLYQLARKAINNNYYLRYVITKSGLKDFSLNVPGELGIYAVNYDAEIAQAWEMTERIIQELANDVKNTGAELLVAYAPPRAAIYPEDWRATRWRYGLRSGYWDIGQPAKELEDICSRHNIPFLDLTTSLRTGLADAGADGARMYFEIDGHWTAEGNAHVARALTSFLDEHTSIGH